MAFGSPEIANPVSSVIAVGSRNPWNPSWSGFASGALMTIREAYMPSCGTETTGPLKATSPSPSRTVTTGA